MCTMPKAFPKEFREDVIRVANESDAPREANKRIKLLEQENEVLRRAAAYLSQANLPGK
jgi:hypothetical protein